MIVFDAGAHTYTNSETHERYISVTTLLEKYKKEFEKDKHSARVAKREGVSQEFVLEMWQEENKKATDKGTKIHKYMEEYIKTGEEKPGYSWMYSSYNNVVLNNIDRHKTVLCENLLYNDTYAIAGTADLIYDHGDYFTIGDLKTNKRFNFSSKYNEYLLPPVDHLQHCEHNAYCLQLSMYGFMHEQATGKKCKKLVVFYLKDDVWVPVHLNYLKMEVMQLMKEYRLKMFQG